MYSCTISLTSALDGGGWLTPRPGRFAPGKDITYPLYRRLGGHQDQSGRVRKISPPAGIFFCILLYFVLHPFLFLCLDYRACCLMSLLATHNTNIRAPGGIRTRNPSKRSAADPRLRVSAH